MSHSAFVSIAPGLEEALADELRDLGLRGKVEPGGVSLTASDEDLWAIHLHSHLAGRVTIELGAARVTTLDALGARIRELPWKKYIWPSQPVEVKISQKGGHFRRREVVERKVLNAIQDALRGPRLPGPRPPREPVSVLIRLDGDRGAFSIDASGELLHRRGWRKATAKAPLRENLAAAMLRLADWDPGEALVDPMCGSGTFGIEAACIAGGRAPGAWRPHALQRWPSTDVKAWAAAVARAKEIHPIDATAPILVADRDDGAIEATRSNAERARVLSRLTVRACPMQDLEPPAKTGLMIINPPYGSRISGANTIGTLYRSMGHTLRERWVGWRVAILLPAPKYMGSLRLPLVEVTNFKNGGIPVYLFAGVVPPPT